MKMQEYMKQTIISIISPSGGVGKSTITKELAIAISTTQIDGSNIKTCIIDANYFGSQRAMLQTIAKYSIIDWINAYREDSEHLSYQEIDQKYSWEYIEQFLAYVADYSLYLLPAPTDGKHYDINEVEMNAILYALAKYFDVILIDTGNNLDSITLSSIRLSNEALLIVTDERGIIENVRSFRKRLRQEDIPLDKINVIMNRHPQKQKNRLFSKEEVESILYLNVCAILPDEPQCWKYNNAGLPIVNDNKSPLYHGLRSIAHMLVPQVDKK